MQLANIHLWWLILSVPLVFVLFRRHERLRFKKLQTFADIQLLPLLIERFSALRRTARYEVYLLTAVTFLLVLTLLRPQWGFVWKESTRKGVDIVVAVDVSESMMAQDVRPNRLTRARREIQDLIESFHGDRVGLISFAGSAFLECPLTLDYGAFNLFLTALSPALIPIKGTNIESAVLESIKAFQRAVPEAEAGKNPARQRALILITDGEDFEGDFEYTAKIAEKENVRIYIMGIGTPEGAPIPANTGYKKDKAGKLVITRLNQEALQELAKKTGGIYVTSISSDRDTKAIYDWGIHEQLEAGSLEYTRGQRWNEYFQVPLLLALACMIYTAAGGVISLRRRKSTPPAVTPALLLFCCLPWQTAHAESPEALGAGGKEAFEKGDFKESLEKFSQAAAEEKDDYRFKLGIGASYYRLGDFTKAKEAFAEATAAAKAKPSKAQAIFNAGNSMVQMGDFKDAIASYENVLKLSPDDKETKENLEYAKKLLERQKQQKQEDQSKKDGKEGKDSKDKKDQQNKDQQQGKGQDQNGQQKSEQNQQQEPGKKQDQQQSDKPQNQQPGGEGKGEENKSPENSAKDPQKNDEQKEQQKSADSKEPSAEDKKDSNSNPEDGGQGKDRNKDKDGKQQDSPNESAKKPSEDPKEPGNEEGENNQPDKKSGDSGQQQGKTPDSPAQDAADKEGSAGANKQGKEQQDKKGKASYDQLDAQLDSLEESTSKRMKYRLQKGMEQLEELERNVPAKDW